MSYALTKGRLEPCRDNVGGIKCVYLMKYIKYPHSLISGFRNSEVTNFPTTTVYKYDTVNARFSESINDDDEGVSYSQSLTFSLLKTDLQTTVELNAIKDLEFRYLVEYNAGYLKIGGLINGASIDSFSIDGGGSKSDFTGYNITMTSEEEYASSFISLDLFNLSGDNYIFEDLVNFIFEDGNNFIFN